MAQKVGYFENYVVFTEGPFVMVNASGWRVEVERPGYKCPVLPDPSIYRFLEANGLEVPNGSEAYKSLCAEDIEKLVDYLNAQVRESVIRLQDKGWLVFSKL